MKYVAFKQGFTLIELLVVVLIIGILAAVALPQYQIAVLKSRYTHLIAIAESITKAEQIYYLANGYYTDNLDALDIEIPGFDRAKYETDGTKYAINGEYQCHVNASDISIGNNEIASGEVYCALKRENTNIGYHMYFGNQIHKTCYVKKAASNVELLKKVCKVISGQEGWSWDTRIGFTIN